MVFFNLPNISMLDIIEYFEFLLKYFWKLDMPFLLHVDI